MPTQPPQAPPPPAPRPKMLPLQKAKPPVRVPTGGKYAKPRGRAPLNAEGKPASWDPDLGEWVGASSSVLISTVASSHLCCCDRRRPQLVLLQYYRCPYPRPIITHTRRRRQEEEAERHPQASRKGSSGRDVGLRQGRVGRWFGQTEASRGEEAGAEEKRCCSFDYGREGRRAARHCPIGRESHPEEGATGR